MLDFSDLESLEWPTHLGNIELTADNAPQDIDQAWDYVNSLDQNPKGKKNTPDVYAIDGLELCEVPPVVSEVLNSLPVDVWDVNAIPQQHHTGGYVQREILTGLIADGLPGTTNGIDWHKDPNSIIAMNLVGNTEWFFLRPIEHSIKMRPGDCLYIPAGMTHKVIAEPKRFTLAFNLRSQGLPFGTPKHLYEKYNKYYNKD